jgi:hypothetical protein
VSLSAALFVAGGFPAAAQIVGVNPAQQQQCAGFVPIRQQVEQGMASLKAASDRKAPREEFCQIFQKLAVSTAKIVRFFEQNKTVCGVPDEALQRARSDYAKSVGFRKQACSAAPPSGPSLSDVLGAPVLPDSSSNRPDVGTFNTLTGNPLTR